MPRPSYTYGVMPTREVFEKAYRAEVADRDSASGLYHMKLIGQDSAAVRGTVFEEASGQSARFTMDEVWTGLKQLKRKLDRGGRASDAAGDLASGILESIGIEWL